mmetsp:Transcript_6422/g.18937  ORF Transcript_6422/g.18937 Transcript_6422/m.18937 type:complete len:224 (+) Transcript_6422:1004-1675(+)
MRVITLATATAMMVMMTTRRLQRPERGCDGVHHPVQSTCAGDAPAVAETPTKRAVLATSARRPTKPLKRTTTVKTTMVLVAVIAITTMRPWRRAAPDQCNGVIHPGRWAPILGERDGSTKRKDVPQSGAVDPVIRRLGQQHRRLHHHPNQERHHHRHAEAGKARMKTTTKASKTTTTGPSVVAVARRSPLPRIPQVRCWKRRWRAATRKSNKTKRRMTGAAPS